MVRTRPVISVLNHHSFNPDDYQYIISLFVEEGLDVIRDYIFTYGFDIANVYVLPTF